MTDLSVSAWFHAHTHPVLTQALLLVTNLHGTLGICLMAAALGLVLLKLRRPWWLLALVLSVPGGLVLNALVKQVFRRARPHFDDPLLSLPTYSFPSGHTAGATVFYGFLAVLLLAHVEAPRWRAAIAGGAAAMVLLVGISRIYLGVHYLSDVVGAIVEGLLWLALCFGAVRALRRRRAGVLQA
ncbi:MAG: phosphatase PAP2 family protein [Burkholderiales bacterium]|nr:phosphatase PAP2 family protein [Burkholderiales bacterium]